MLNFISYSAIIVLIIIVILIAAILLIPLIAIIYNILYKEKINTSNTERRVTAAKMEVTNKKENKEEYSNSLG